MGTWIVNSAVDQAFPPSLAILPGPFSYPTQNAAWVASCSFSRSLHLMLLSSSRYFIYRAAINTR